MQYIPHRRYESHLSPCTKLQLHTLELPLSTVPKIQSAHTSTHTPPSHPSQIPNLLSLIAPPIHSPSFPAILISISRLSRRITVSSARNPSLSSLLTHIYTHTRGTASAMVDAAAARKSISAYYCCYIRKRERDSSARHVV